MSIKARLVTLIAAFTVTLVVLGVMLSYALHTSRQLAAGAGEARAVHHAALELSLLLDDYTAAPTKRAEKQWWIRHGTLGALIGRPSTGLPGEEAWRNDIGENRRRLGVHFEDLSDRLIPAARQVPEPLTPHEIRVAGQMRMLVLSIAEATSSYAAALEAERSSAERQVLVLAVAIAAGSAALTLGAGITVWYTLGAPLAALQRGVRRMAEGDLDHRLSLTGRGEFGELAQAFNEMAEAVDRDTEDLEVLVEQRTGQLLEVNRRLEDATQAKDRFMARMSHELRTPLNSIIGFSQIMRDGGAGPVSDEQAVQLEMVNRAGKRLLSLVNDLLDISRIAAGGIEVGCGPVAVGDLIGDLVDTVDPLAAEAGLVLEHSSAGPLEIVTDRAKVEQILLNFLSNAIKFTDSGTISLRAEADEGGGVRVSVRDTGRGIAPEHFPELFDEFKQFSSPEDPVQPGSGLGLAIARSLADLLGGHIEVESDPGIGSTFTLVLPAEPPGAAGESSGGEIG